MDKILDAIYTVIGTPLGYLMRWCYVIFNDYGLALILFTLATKVIMFPISLLVQKNSIKMIKMKPELEALKYQYVDDKDAYADAQFALYKKEKYSPFAGVIPLLLQLPIILGLIDVVYKPLKHILHIPADVIDSLVTKAAEVMNTTVEKLGTAAQLSVVELLKNPETAKEFASIEGAQGAISSAQALNMNFLCFDLSAQPHITALNILFLVPIIAGITAFILCWVQNRINVLQIEQSKLSQWGMTIFMIAFSTYFAFIVPAGVGLYWAWGNLFAIGVMYLVNLIYSPKSYIDYKALDQMKKQAKITSEEKKKNKKLAIPYYKKFCKTENLENMKVMFYAEGKGYYKYFSNVIDAVIENSDIVIHYVTSDPNDPILNTQEKQIVPYYVDETRLISLMMKVEADIVVMTTPDLEKYHIKRSKVRKDVEYIYLDHGCSSINLTYRTGALDYFDTIFAVSRAQALETRAIEELRHTKKKKIIKYGYGLIDNMIASYEASEKKENEKKTILIAPSWQYDNLMDSCLDDLVESLDGKGYKIVIRPHPQYVRRFPLRIAEIKDKYKDRFNEDFSIETDFSSNVTVYTADLLITDWSAISFEFSFTTNKPTLFINTQMKVVNRDYDKIDIVPFDISARNEIGISVEKSDVKNIYTQVEYLLTHYGEFSEKIDTLKHEHFYNLGQSGQVGAKYIIERIKGTRKKKHSDADSADNN